MSSISKSISYNMLIIVNKYEMLRFRICASALGTCSSYMRWHSFRSYQPGNSLKEWPCYSSSVKPIERKHLKNRHPFLTFKFLVKLPLFLTWCCCWGRTGGPSVYHILPASRFLKSGFLEDFTLLVLPFSGVFYHQVHRTNHSPIIHSTTKYSEYQQINK